MFKLLNVNLSQLKVNEGQVNGLPKNPRFIRDERFEALKKSIVDAPEMMSLREIIAYDNDGEYVVIGGNMRFRALLELGYKETAIKLLDKDTPIAKLREYTIKDNVAFGQLDWDTLANEWDENELADWGMDNIATNIGDGIDIDSFLTESENSTAKNEHDICIEIKIRESYSDKVEDIKTKIHNIMEDIPHDIKVK